MCAVRNIIQRCQWLWIEAHAIPMWVVNTPFVNISYLLRNCKHKNSHHLLALFSCCFRPNEYIHDEL